MFVDAGALNPSTGDWSVALSLCAGTAITSFLFSGARYGLESVSRSKLRRLKPDDADPARFERYLEHLDRSLVGALLVMVLSDSLFGLSLYVIVKSLLPTVHATIAIFLTAASVSIYLVLCGRVLARALVERDAERVVIRLLPWLHGIGLVLTPLTGPITRFRRQLVAALAPDDPHEKGEAFTEELKATLEEGERDGVVEKDEAEIIENVVEFRDLDVRQVMTPRTDVDWVEGGTTLVEALRLASERGHARLPVGENDGDHLVAIFYVRDVIDRLDEFPTLRDAPVRDFARKAHYVPETKHVVELLKEFKQHKIQIAVVLDEYGGTAGVVTVTDILESLVGEIHDEHDPKSDTHALQVIDGDHAVVDGKTRIDVVNGALGIDLPEADGVDSIGGLVFSTLGRVPQKGETVHLEGVEIHVLDADERRLKQLDVKVLSRNPR